MIRTTSTHDAACSAVDLNGLRHVFASATPPSDGDFERQARDVLGVVDDVARDQGVRGSIVQQAVFLSDSRQIEKCRQIVRDFYGDDLPATSYIPQAPCSGKLLEIEVMGVDPRRGGADIRRLSERTVTVRHDGVTWA